MTRTSAAKTAAEILAEARIDNFVPLLEELLNVGSYEAALGMSIRAAMETTMFTALACLLTYVGMISTSKRDPQKGSTALGDFFNALSQPVFHLLPFYSVLRLGTITCAMLQYIALQMPEEFTKIMGFQTENATRMLTRGTQFLEDSCELMLITFLAWFVIRIKDRILSEIQLNFQVEKRAESSGIVRLIESAKSLSSIAISLLSIIMALRAYGLDIGPLLTSLGASSIILGFAAQSTLQNLFSGISIYSSKLFVVGDSIELHSTAGGKVVEGVVELVTPLTCVIRDDQNALIYVSNTQLTSLILKNKSQSVVI